MSTQFSADNQANVLNLLWMAMLGSPASLYGILIVMDYLELVEPVLQTSAEYLFYIAIAFIPAAVIMLHLFRTANGTYLETIKREPEQAKLTGQIFQQKLIMGIAVADSPGTIGIVYYFLSGEMERSALLIITSLVLCYLFKPELPNR